MFKSEFEFTLKTHLKYDDTSVGQVSVTDKLILFAPSKRHGTITSKFRQKLILAIKKNSEFKKDTSIKEEVANSNVEDSNDKEGENFVKFLYTLSDIDMSEMFDLFGKLLVSGICFIPPVTTIHKISLTEELCNNLSVYDFERLMGDYILNFFLS